MPPRKKRATVPGTAGTGSENLSLSVPGTILELDFDQLRSNQPFGIRILSRHLENNKSAHTYLMTCGLPHTQKQIAMGLACALNCEKTKVFQRCECNSCMKIQKGLHPDIHWVGRDEDASSIKIEEIREIIAKAALKPYEGKMKVFILIGAERLTLDASNALLKSLEEPPAKTMFILLAESKSSILETIQSRAFDIRLRPEVWHQSPLSKAEFGLTEIKNVPWEDYLNPDEGLSREALANKLAGLAQNFRSVMQQCSDQNELGILLQCIDFTLETKAAVEDNVNQKLALTRLAMQLRKQFV